jgi:hypothetical protein
MSDVQPLVGAALARLPAAWTADAIQPDPAALADWMRRVLETSGGLKLTRSADPYDHAVAYLKAEGVDVERELARAGREREYGTHQTRAAADRARDLALDLKAAEKRLLAEARGVNAGAQGFTPGKLREAEQRVGHLTAQLTAACCDDPELARSVRRSVA